MVSAWDVYWVLQLDSIVQVFIGLALASACMVVGCGIGIIESYGDDEAAWRGRAFKAAASFVFFLLATGLTPTSRTAAAMILVPKLTSPEVLQPVGAEAKELYGLAKDALRRIGKDDKPEATP